MRLRCLLGLHDFYAIYPPLILVAKEKVEYQYITVKRICVFCKHKEEFIVQLSQRLQDWDVLLSAPNFVSEELKKE